MGPIKFFPPDFGTVMGPITFPPDFGTGIGPIKVSPDFGTGMGTIKFVLQISERVWEQLLSPRFRNGYGNN